MNASTCLLLALGSLLVAIDSVCVNAQNTILPEPIQSYVPGFWNTDVFAPSAPRFALGHQWGAARLDKVNTALKMNVTNQNWGYLHDHAHEMYKLGKGDHDTNYIVWAEPLHWTPGPIGEVFRQPWYGMRWEPAENSGLERDWVPRDEQSWPLSFAVKYHGTIPTSPTDVNYRRYLLDTASMTTTPIKALDDVEPRNHLKIYRSVNWHDPLEEKFINSIAGSDTTFHEDSSDCRRLQLVLNLRRVNASDDTLDDAPVVSVVVPYHMRWKDQADTTPSYLPISQRMPFRLVPKLDKDSVLDLPLDRGLEMKTRTIDLSAEYVDSIVITRQMLPLHSDPGDPDITLVAEFRTDTIWGIEVDGPDTTFQVRRPHVLKNSLFDFPAQPITDSALLANSDTASYNRRYQAIDSLGVTVWYHGHSAVAIRSASLLTPLTKRATSGYYDTSFVSRFEIHRDSIRNRIDSIGAHTGRTLRLLAFYTNDEFDNDQLLGMRYKLEFLDRRLTSETGYDGGRTVNGNFRSGYGRQKFQGFPSKFLWTTGLTTPTRPTAAPYVARTGVVEFGFNTNAPVPAPLMSLKAGYRWASDESPFRRYETDIITNFYGPQVRLNLPLPSTTLDYTTLPVYEGIMHADNAMVGPSAMQEHLTYATMYQTGDWYFAARRYYWTNFFYHLDMKYGFDDAGRPYVRYDKFQPLTGEAVRMGHGTALNLGTRGFMYDKWCYQDDLMHNNRLYVVPHPDDVDTVTNYGRIVFGEHFFPGYITEDTTAHIMDDLPDSVVSADSLLKSEHLGGDYYTTTERLRINDWTPLTTLASEMQLGRFMSGTTSQKVYVGRLSVRMETKWWHDLVTDTTTSSTWGSELSNAEIFMKTRPIGWFGKGYRNLANGDSVRLRMWVDAFADSLKVQRWTRRSSTDTTLILEAEPLGEQLYDVVLLDTAATGASDDNCILAITNRRTSPFLFNASLPDSIEWVSSYEHDTLTRGARPDLRYKQVGARRITIPFNYSVDVTKPYLLHIRELRPHYDSLFAIDTIVSWNSNLAVDFRPGDTRYFHIRRLQATDTVGTGYLAYSTQNKMVAYPVLNQNGSGYGDSLRYHLVFHRKDTDPQRTGPWTVYYQRSRPYHRDSLPLVAGLDWEAPIRLSRVTTASTPSTDGVSRTRYYAIDTAAYEGHVPDTAGTGRDCCCGFPSIVVRETEANTPKVFVVYACEDMWAPEGIRNDYFHIVENAFLDQATLTPAALEVNGKSLVITGKDIGHDVPPDIIPPIEDYVADTLGSLAVYGTPVINASAQHRMYYAWSAANSGIGAGMKSDTDDWFPAPDALIAIPSPTITWLYDHDSTTDTVLIQGGVARFPSLNVYSNLAHDRTDATLVWQEGVNNQHIRYTRLVPGGGTAIGRMLPDFVDMSFDIGSPPSIPVDAANAIAIVGGALPGEEAELPVVVRSLQQDTMSMFIRDSSGTPTGLYRYNHESIAWGEWVTSLGRSRVRYNHFVDMTGFSAPELHYWWMNTTASTGGMSLFHPVVTNGAVRLDSLTWQGMVDDTLVTYDDSLHIVHGNLSDSALIVNYTILNSGAFTALRTQRLAGYASYWTGHGQFDDLQGQQIHVRRMPGIPASPAITYHYDYLRADGAWPHLAMRQRESWPEGILSVRRVLQYTNTSAPSIIASAEQFYKEHQGKDRTEPVASGGFEKGGEHVTLRAAFDDGRSISFTPVYDVNIPDGFTGSMDYA